MKPNIYLPKDASVQNADIIIGHLEKKRTKKSAKFEK